MRIVWNILVVNVASLPTAALWSAMYRGEDYTFWRALIGAYVFVAFYDLWVMWIGCAVLAVGAVRIRFKAVGQWSRVRLALAVATCVTGVVAAVDVAREHVLWMGGGPGIGRVVLAVSGLVAGMTAGLLMAWKPDATNVGVSR